ncbi:MAG: HEPN domain-containing protein, partial [Candidatus Bathyarchaeia archaeon]
MSEVSPLGQVRLQDYSEIIGETEIGSLETLAEQIRGRSVVHVNATSYGGGVAEILHSMISLMRNMGLDAHWKVIKGAEREFKNAASCLESEDHSGSLKYLQECMEYAVKAVLIAYGIDYPKIHAVGRFLFEIEEKCPEWFLKQIPSIAEVTDSLARG